MGSGVFQPNNNKADVIFGKCPETPTPPCQKQLLSMLCFFFRRNRQHNYELVMLPHIIMSFAHSIMVRPVRSELERGLCNHESH